MFILLKLICILGSWECGKAVVFLIRDSIKFNREEKHKRLIKEISNGIRKDLGLTSEGRNDLSVLSSVNRKDNDSRTTEPHAAKS